MAKWEVHLDCSIGFTVTNIDRNTAELAFSKARKVVLDTTKITADNNVKISEPKCDGYGNIDRPNKPWEIDLYCDIEVTVTDVDADTKEQAIKNAWKIAQDNINIINTGDNVVPMGGGLECDECLYTRLIK